jgi:hypothetical protein
MISWFYAYVEHIKIKTKTVYIIHFPYLDVSQNVKIRQPQWILAIESKCKCRSFSVYKYENPSSATFNNCAWIIFSQNTSNLAGPDAFTNEIKSMSPNCSFKTWIKKMLLLIDTPLNYSCFGRKLFMRSCWMLQTTGFHICKQKTIDNCTWNLLRRTSIGSFVERDFFIRILLKVYFDFA